jgi:type I restriction enzyme M protein
MAGRKKNNGNGNGKGRRLATQQSVDQAVKSICDIMRRGNCAGAMQYVPELTWILFLRILDEKEHREEQETDALGVPFRPSLETPFRWRDWAAPPETLTEGRTNKRVDLQNSPQNAFFNFVNAELLPHLKGLRNRPACLPAPESHQRDHDRRRAGTDRHGAELSGCAGHTGPHRVVFLLKTAS